MQASTLGSLEALLEFLRSDAVRIPVSGINIGPVHKRDVMRASTMLEKGRKKFAVILAFDVPVTREAQEQANSTGVRIFTADIIYHLFDQFSAYLKQVASLNANGYSNSCYRKYKFRDASHSQALKAGPRNSKFQGATGCLDALIVKASQKLQRAAFIVCCLPSAFSMTSLKVQVEVMICRQRRRSSKPLPRTPFSLSSFKSCRTASSIARIRLS